MQIGIRGGLYSDKDKEWGLDQGIRVIEIEEFFDLAIRLSGYPGTHYAMN